MITKSVYPSDDDIDVDLVIKNNQNGNSKIDKATYRKCKNIYNFFKLLYQLLRDLLTLPTNFFQPFFVKN